MKLIIEKRRGYIRNPDEERGCLTPDAIYKMSISPNEVSVSVKLPIDLNIDEEEAKALEDDMHDAMEAILAKYFEDK
jgi:hypothetical protein